MGLRPIPGDPGGAEVAAAFDMASDDWWLSDAGDYQTGACEAFKDDGSNFQRLVMLEWPTRRNNSDELRTLRLLISPEDALGLAQVLAHTAAWMLGADE